MTKVRGREGNSPDRQTKVPNYSLSGKGGGYSVDNQEVGLEAAIP